MKLKLTALPIAALFTFCLIAFVAGPVNAEVTSRPCPYSCKSLGIKKKKCKDWKEGNTCYVQDLRKKSGKRKGNVSSKPCPHSCASAGIPKRKCKDWKEGNTCYVQDLR